MIVTRIITLVMLLFMVACSDPVYADNHLTDTRCCIDPARNADGSIKRNRAVVKAFERLYPLPEGYDRGQWQVNHAVPLVCGGKDIVSNLIWMRKEAKTCAEDWCQDRHEQITMCPK